MWESNSGLLLIQRENAAYNEVKITNSWECNVCLIWIAFFYLCFDFWHLNCKRPPFNLYREHKQISNLLLNKNFYWQSTLLTLYDDQLFGTVMSNSTLTDTNTHALKILPDIPSLFYPKLYFMSHYS